MNIAVILLPLLLSLISALLLTLSGDLMWGDRRDNTVITLLLSRNCQHSPLPTHWIFSSESNEEMFWLRDRWSQCWVTLYLNWSNNEEINVFIPAERCAGEMLLSADFVNNYQILFITFRQLKTSRVTESWLTHIFRFFDNDNWRMWWY